MRLKDSNGEPEKRVRPASRSCTNPFPGSWITISSDSLPSCPSRRSQMPSKAGGSLWTYDFPSGSASCVCVFWAFMWELSNFPSLSSLPAYHSSVKRTWWTPTTLPSVSGPHWCQCQRATTRCPVKPTWMSWSKPSSSNMRTFSQTPGSWRVPSTAEEEAWRITGKGPRSGGGKRVPDNHCCRGQMVKQNPKENSQVLPPPRTGSVGC